MNLDDIAVIVMTRNEAANIVACLQTLADFPHVYVVDCQSQDDTLARARQARAGVEIIPFVWNRQYPRKKQWCLNHVGMSQPWVLFVDADEQMTPLLQVAIVAAHPMAAWYLRSRMVWMGRDLHYGCRYQKIALIRRDAGYFPDVRDEDMMGDWAVEGHIQPIINGPVGVLTPPLRHHDHKGITAWFDRHNRYSDWEAKCRYQQDIKKIWRGEGRGRFIRKWLLHHLPMRPLWVFLHDYVLRLGALDGRAGFDMALARAFYYWQIGLKQRALAATSRVQSGAQHD